MRSLVFFNNSRRAGKQAGGPENHPLNIFTGRINEKRELLQVGWGDAGYPCVVVGIVADLLLQCADAALERGKLNLREGR